MTTPSIAARLASVVDRLAALDIDANVDPAKVPLPGVWVHWTGLDLSTLADGYVLADLVCMVPANELGAAIPALEDLVDEVLTEFGRPDGDIRTQATTLPNDGAPAPSVVLPYVIT